MNENNTPDAETFDIADWITGGAAHRPVKTVTVYKDLSLNAAVEDIRQRLAAMPERTVPTDAEGNPEETLGGDEDEDDERAQLEAEAEALLERMRSAKVTLKVRGLIGPELEKIKAKLKPTGKTESDTEYTYEVLAQAVEFPGGQRLSAKQWAAFHDGIGQGQFIRVTQTYQAAMLQVPEVSAPFSPKSSRAVTGQ